MSILIVSFLGLVLFGNDFFKFSVGPLSVMTLLMLWTGAYYLKAFLLFFKRHYVVEKTLGAMLILTAYGVLFAAISYTGLLSSGLAGTVLIDFSYIPRQAYYLFFFPLAALAPRLWTRGKSYFFFRRHAVGLGFALYFASLLVQGDFSLTVSTTLAISACLLATENREKKKTVGSWALLLVLILTPVGVGGEFTQIVIRGIAAAYYLLSKEQKRIGKILWFVVALTVAGSFVSGIVLAYIPLELDANSAWRLHYWADEISVLMKTWGLGAGYGTSYASIDFLSSNGFGAAGGPFAATAEYTPLQRAFLTGSHNSFISLSYRLGFIGILMLIVFLRCCYKKISSVGFVPSFVCCFFFASLFIIAFNVGLESPAYLFCFLLGAALSLANWRDEDTGNSKEGLLRLRFDGGK